MFTPVEKKTILDLADSAIKTFLRAGALLVLSKEEVERVPARLKNRQSCFVTLTINKNLRGCIGHLEGIQPLYLDIIENATAAANADPRFAPLTEAEFPDVAIEVSVLSAPAPLSYPSPDDLLKKLRASIDGVVIRKGNYGATYLPQVWEELPDKQEFLSSLCLKAGLPADQWRKNDLEVKTYQAESVK